MPSLCPSGVFDLARRLARPILHYHFRPDGEETMVRGLTPGHPWCGRPLPGEVCRAQFPNRPSYRGCASRPWGLLHPNPWLLEQCRLSPIHQNAKGDSGILLQHTGTGETALDRTGTVAYIVLDVSICVTLCRTDCVLVVVLCVCVCVCLSVCLFQLICNLRLQGGQTAIPTGSVLRGHCF